jgi:transposase
VRLVSSCARLRQRSDRDAEIAATAASLRALARRIQLLDAETADQTQAITTLVRAWRRDLLSRCGVGPIVAAVVLGARSHPAAAEAMPPSPCWAAPRPSPPPPARRSGCASTVVGSPAQPALHLVVLTRLRDDPATRAYAQRRRAQGKTNREIRRCLVHYVARQLHRLLEANPSFDPT